MIDKRTAEKILDTGILNDTMEAYFVLAMKRAELDKESARKVLRRLPSVFDEYTASEALENAWQYY